MFSFWSRYMHDIVIAMEAIMGNKLKSMLTALGIIFGVAAVISMMAIGNGGQQEILEQIKMVGVNNIVIMPVLSSEESEESSEEGESQVKKFSPGLTLADAQAIKEILPSVQRISPEVTVDSYVISDGRRYSAKMTGVSVDFFSLYNLPLTDGTYFTEEQDEQGLPVCVIGHNIKTKFFNQVNPIGQQLKFGSLWLKVVGVLEPSEVSVSTFENTGVNVYNDNVFIPIKTMLMRYQNRALANSKKSENAVSFRGGGMRVVVQTSGTASTEASKNYHQLDRIIVQIKETAMINSSMEVLSRMIFRRHQGVEDYQITVPEMLLKQQQRTNEIFNIVLGAIAGISLLVGGIGIMNIMFASVMERIKEIGTRLAIGAKKKDIIVQFLAEAVLISVSGGLVGVIFGVVLASVISSIFEIKTIVSGISVAVAFGVSALVGIIFGYAPAKRAAERDPIESLRYE